MQMSTRWDVDKNKSRDKICLYSYFIFKQLI
nr:MAG TPA: hypothetical protein [Bacteriophage sp.]